MYSQTATKAARLLHELIQLPFLSNIPVFVFLWLYLFIYLFSRLPSVLWLSVLWHCWLGGRKGIRPVKYWVVGCWRGYLSGAKCRLAWPSWCHCHSLSLASVKSRLVLPFWYRLTRVVPEKGPLNGCVCVCVLVDCLPSPVYKSSVWTSKEEYETSHGRTEGMGRTKPATTARKTSSSDQSEYGRMPCDSSSQATTAKLQTSDAGEKQRRRRTSGAHQRTSRRPHRCRTVRQNCAGYRARCSPKKKWGDAWNKT